MDGRAGRITQKVYQAYLDHFGEPDRSRRFGDGSCQPGEEHFPSWIDVFIWRGDEEIDITTFATIGVSEKPMEECSHRAEMHFAIRREFTEAEENQVCVFLANLAVYPFHHRTHFNWWHTLGTPGNIPLFSDEMAVLLHPAFVEEGWDYVNVDNLTVKILNVVPITQEERAMVRQQGAQSLLNLWEEQEIDIFAPR